MIFRKKKPDEFEGLIAAMAKERGRGRFIDAIVRSVFRVAGVNPEHVGGLLNSLDPVKINEIVDTVYHVCKALKESPRRESHEDAGGFGTGGD